MSGVCATCGTPLPESARFCPDCGGAVAGGQAAPSGDELRPVTALFADVVGSTALGERLAPDEVKALVGECVTRLARAVEEYGGLVQAYMGDGICAYFGVPTAREDDPERAARAALRILGVVREYAEDIRGAWGIEDFDVRVGINGGQAAVGVVGGSDPQPVALGDATNVAARLQSSAAPGSIVIGEATARRLASRFELQPLGAVEVKGRADAVAAWRLLRPLGGARTAATGPLVGREAELDRLREVVGELVEAGRGQVLLITGEAGIGKTRLLAEVERLAGDRVTWLEGECLSYGGLAGWPFVQLLRRWLDADIGAPEVVVRTKARAKLAAVLGDRAPEVLVGFARVLRLRLEEGEARDEGPLGGAAAAYAEWLEALAAERPVVLALEDVHWADEATRALAAELLTLTDRAPVLVVATLRLDPGSPGADLRSHVLSGFSHRALELALGSLADEDARALLHMLLPGGVDEPTADELVARAEGNPLYLEELMRALVEGGGLARRRTWTLTVSSQALLPPALENLLVSRIDHLPPEARRVAQVAAVIGREFPLGLLRAAGAAEDVEGALGLLLRAGIVREVRRFPEPSLAFKHGLLHDAALSTLTPARRRELAGAVAAAAETLYGGSLDGRLEPLARWHAEGGDLRRAVALLERAADGAAEPEAAELLRRAKRLAEREGDTEAAARIDARLSD
ncbi:MAG: AAA family ATPase [Gaiellaceae bacterium]